MKSRDLPFQRSIDCLSCDSSAGGSLIVETLKMRNENGFHSQWHENIKKMKIWKLKIWKIEKKEKKQKIEKMHKWNGISRYFWIKTDTKMLSSDFHVCAAYKLLKWF
jgi:O-methyltransferase involved in polyketide biosynthesis